MPQLCALPAELRFSESLLSKIFNCTSTLCCLLSALCFLCFAPSALRSVSVPSALAEDLSPLRTLIIILCSAMRFNSYLYTGSQPPTRNQCMEIFQPANLCFLHSARCFLLSTLFSLHCHMNHALCSALSLVLYALCAMLVVLFSGCFHCRL
jgi:hypothetical protein